MNKCIALLGLILSAILTSSAVQAQIRFINSDGAALGDICIVSVESRKTVEFLTRELGLTPVDTNSMFCHGQSVRNSIASYGNDDFPEYIFNVGDQAPEIKMCIAAITVAFMVAEVKAEFFSDSPDIEEEIRCNGMSLQQFAGKYREI